ncbi:YaaC family protein [Streptomyces sp. NPDC005828]|uniref:YaaC family protein n=1 Tax=Streptomyces sp. NPDC005828 TaxID=3157071 RepID=UPI00340447B1
MDYLVYAWLTGLPTRLLRGDAEAKIENFLAKYPTLAGAEGAGDSMNRIVRHGSGAGFQVPRRWRGKEDPAEIQLRLTSPYLGDDVRYVFPGLGSVDLPLHPFLGWWAVLYTLSMLARYQPSGWVRMLDIDMSPDAAAIEHALDRALDVVPELIYYLIRATGS